MEEQDFRFVTGGDPHLEYRTELGSGCSASVHEIYDIPGQRSFARKLLYPQSRPKQMLAKEVNAIKKLCGPGAHVNIVQVLAHGQLPNAPYFLYFIDMELCDLNLHDYIHQKPAAELSNSMPRIIRGMGSASALQIWVVMSQIAAGVEYIHRKGHVHRDIKPANVLYSHKDGMWKLADFGLTVEGSSGTNRHTEYASGTQGYRAPELLISNTEPTYTKKVDIWSMGCILFELATQIKAFESDWAVFTYYKSKNIDWISEKTFDAQSINEHIVNMLQINPSDRPSASILSREFSLERQAIQVDVSSSMPLATSDDTEQTQSTVQNDHNIIGDSDNSTPLYCAAEKGDIEAVKILLDANEDINAQGGFYGNALQAASANGHEPVVQLLLEAGADVNSRESEWGPTPLSRAARNGHLGAVKVLVQAGADVESKDDAGRTPLSWAAANGHLEAVKWLAKEAGADVETKDKFGGKTPLSYVAVNGHLDLLEWLVQEGGADVESKDYRGRTPLSLAAENGSVEAVKWLAQEAKAKVDSKDNRGQTPLSLAAENGSLEAVKWLVQEAGADVASKDNRRQTPLSLAAEKGRLEAVKWLVQKASADVDSKDSRGQTPLSLAAEKGHLEAVKWLVMETRVDVDSKDNRGQTPLSLAAENGSLEVVKWLGQEAGATVDSKDNRGRTPLSLAAEKGRLEAVKWLVMEAKANVDSKDNRGQTPLSLAAENGSLEAVKWLVKEARADVESKDEDGKTALDLARLIGKKKWPWSEQCKAVAAWLESRIINLPESEDLGSFFQRSRYADEYMAATFSVTFPFAAAGLIRENTAILQRKVQTLPGTYLFEAGYDIIPGDCKLLVPEQLDCFSGLNQKALSTNRFSGMREMLWIVRFDNNKLPKSSDEEIAEIHYPIMHSIAQNIYSPVGFLDLDNQIALAFDKESMISVVFESSDDGTPSPLEAATSTFDRVLGDKFVRVPDRRSPHFRPNSTASASHDRGGTSERTSNAPEQPRAATPTTGHQPARNTQEDRPPAGGIDGNGNEQSGGPPDHPSGSPPASPHNSTTVMHASPFICKADFIGLDGRGQEISLTMELRAENLWGDASRGRKSRSACRLIAESFTAKLAGLNSGQGHLRLQHMQLQIGPTVTADRNESGLESYLTQLHCYDQEPDEATLKAVTRTELNNVSATIQGGFPNGAAVSATYQGGTSETYPSNIYGYDRTWIRAGATERVHAWWGYPIEFRHFIESPTNYHARRLGHSSKFSYPSHQPPCAQRVQFSLICDLPCRDRRANTLLTKFVPYGIEHNGKVFPCRNICLKLEIDLLPTNDGTFIYPQTTAGGHYLYLGAFKFIERDGQICLRVDRKTRDPVALADPHLCTKYGISEKNWNFFADKGMIRVSEREKDGEEPSFSMAGNLNFKLVNPASWKKLLQRE